MYVLYGNAAAGRRPSLLSACNLLMTIFKDSRTDFINIVFIKRGISADVKGLRTHNRIRGMVEEQDFHEQDPIFLFVAAFVGGAMGENVGTSSHTSIPTVPSFEIC